MPREEEPILVFLVCAVQYRELAKSVYRREKDYQSLTRLKLTTTECSVVNSVDRSRQSYEDFKCSLIAKILFAVVTFD